MDLTLSYEELTEEFYGESLRVADMDNDEGGILDMYADSPWHTINLCITAITPETALKHPG